MVLGLWSVVRRKMDGLRAGIYIPSHIIVVHIAFSPVKITDGAKYWYGLGPVSVLPECQKKGIRKSLIKESLSLLKELGGQGYALVGDPNYYIRFGFKNYPELIHEGVVQEVFSRLAVY